MENFEFRDQLKNRTKNLALRIIRLYQALPKNTESQVIGKQLLRSGTSIAANYRAAWRGRSNAEFHSKLSIIVKETDESLFWMELFQEANMIKPELLKDLYQETEDILKIIVTARKNSKKYANQQ